MATTEPALTFTDALVRLSHAVQYVFADASKQHGLTPQQAQLLCRLIDGDMPMGELGRRLHLEKQSITGIVDRIEARGLLARSSDPRDRRTSLVALTAEGLTLAWAVKDSVTSRLESLTGSIGAASRSAITETISAVLLEHTATTGLDWQIPAAPKTS